VAPSTLPSPQATVDFPKYFHYIPNEVKHRKRTRTREKLIGKKDLAASAMAYKKPPLPKEESSKAPEISPVSAQSSSSSASLPESSPTRQAHIPVSPEFPPIPSWSTSQSLSPEIPKHAIRRPWFPQPPAGINLRRPSLPADETEDETSSESEHESEVTSASADWAAFTITSWGEERKTIEEPQYAEDEAFEAESVTVWPKPGMTPR